MPAPLKSMHRRIGRILVAFLGLASVFAIAELTGLLPHMHRAAAAPAELRIKLLWHHQAQFAGFYVAEAMGFFENENLKVELIEGHEGDHPLEALAEGDADVALSWLPSAIAAREDGNNVVNIGQIFTDSGTMILCRRDRGITRPRHVAGKRIGILNIGDELNLNFWLALHHIAASDVAVFQQRPDGADLIDGTADCVTALSYDEYWHILRSGLTIEDLFIVRLADEDLGFLEDGIYVREEDLADPDRRHALTRFLRATVAGWQFARSHPEEALAATMERDLRETEVHQQAMLESALRHLAPGDALGLLDLAAYDHSIDLIAHLGGSPEAVRERAGKVWTHALWYEAGLGTDGVLTPSVATKHYLRKTVSSEWFYLLDLIGTAAFGLAGFMRAQQRRYDLWGAFILTLLPAVGGGTLRDLLIGGDRHPPFIFTDSTYIYVVLATVVVGVIGSKVASRVNTGSRAFDVAFNLCDTIGLATFAVIGAKVAIIADLDWMWVPFFAALTCAGGGMLLDVVTGREPRTFQGEPYEELAVVGGIVVLLILQIADRHEHQPWLVVAAILGAMGFVFAARILVVTRNLRSTRLGEARAEAATGGNKSTMANAIEPAE